MNVTDVDDSSQDARTAELARRLKMIEPNVTYFAATLLGTDERWQLTFQSRFAGWPDGQGPDEGIELREAAPIHVDHMTRLWDELGQGWMAVTEPAHLAWFLRLGGNALIAEDLARKHFAGLVEPHEVVPLGAVGFVNYEPDAREVQHRAPTKKQRMRILERDGFRCQLCGERPSDNEHITLHVHHIRPFGKGGITIDENLIALCQTCHMGLDPHDKPVLFWLPGGHVCKMVENETADAFHEGVEVYRRRAIKMFEALEKGS